MFWAVLLLLTQTLQVGGASPFNTSGAALAEAYHLLAADGDAAVEEILASSIVIIDPVQNPDGRARFLFQNLLARAAIPDATPVDPRKVGADSYESEYDALYEEGGRLAALWRQAEEIHLTTAAGTDLRAPIAGEEVIIECGFATEPGLEAAFSDGEVSQMPRENSAQGVIVVDGPIAHIGAPDSPIRLHVEDGRVTAVDGDCRQAEELRHIVESIENASNIAEIGIGLNPACRRNGDFEEEKKGRGNIHVAIGDNIFYGGTVKSPVHMDMVIYRPTVRLGDLVVVEDGQVRL
ncbi:MAG: aminopeptidase [Pseudomonadota bacterium]